MMNENTHSEATPLLRFRYRILWATTPSCGGKVSAVPPLASYGDEKPFFFYFLERKSVDVRRTGVQ